MLYNNLTNAIRTTDKDGQWSANVNDDTMMERLGATVVPDYEDGAVVTLVKARDAIIDLYPYVGAQAVLYQNDDEEVIAIADVESTFLTGEFNSDGTSFEADGVKYSTTATKVANATYLQNGGAATADYDTLADIAGEKVTIAAKVSGKTLKEVYSVNSWVGKTEQMTSSDITNLSKNDKLNDFEFITDDNDEIDTTSFQLLGVDSLSDIKVDDVVTVYNAAGIVKVEVTDKTVTGVVSKVSGTGDAAKYTIDGVAYELGQPANKAGKANAGDEVTLTLTYAGDIWKIDGATTADNYAIVMNYEPEGSIGTGTITSDDAKVQLYTTEGAMTYVVDTKKVDNFTSMTSYFIGRLVKYTVKDDVNLATGNVISKAGYLDGKEIEDNAVVFSYDGTIGKTTSGYIYVGNESVTSPIEKDDLGLSSKSTILGATIPVGSQVAYVTNDNDEIVAMIIPENMSNEETVYGIVVDSYKSATYDGETAVDLLIDGELKTDIELGNNDLTGLTNCLVEITTNVDGSVDLRAVVDADTDINLSTITVTKENYLYVDGNRVKQANVSTTNSVLASDVIVYVKNEDDNYELGDTSDLEITEAKTVLLYTCDDTKADDYNFVTYAVVK